MILPAERLSTVNEYYFSIKLKEVNALKAQGKPIISLGIGDPIGMPSTSTISELIQTSTKKDSHGYQSYIGLPKLREQMSMWYKKWFKVDLNPNTEVLPLLGSKEGIFHIGLAFLNPGDGVLVPNPGYPTYTSANSLIGANVIKYDLKEENGWLPDFEQLEQTDLSSVKMMWVNYPNMPTGTKATLDLFEKLVAFGKKHNIIICNDNPYSFILNNQRLSILSVEGAKDICIELNSLSKSHNMAGWRVGMCMANPTFTQYIIKVKTNIDSGMFKGVQLAAAEALNNNAEWHIEQNKIYRENRVIAEEIMDALGCTYNKEQVGMFLWGRVPSQYKNGVELSDKLLYNADIFITPGMVFGSNGDNYIRISLCTTTELLKEAKKRISKL